MLTTKNIDIVNLTAEDSHSNENLKDIPSMFQTDPTQTAGLEYNLKLGINAKVMIRRNLNIQQGY
jgi:hypothetical protein